VADTLSAIFRWACTAEDRERLKVDELTMAIIDTNDQAARERAAGGE
jgi:hypothetical protein